MGRALLGAIAGTALALSAQPARAEPAPLVRNEQILIEYMEPRHPVFAYYTDPDDPAQAEDHQTNVKTYKRFTAIMERGEDPWDGADWRYQISTHPSPTDPSPKGSSLEELHAPQPLVAEQRYEVRFNGRLVGHVVGDTPEFARQLAHSKIGLTLVSEVPRWIEPGVAPVVDVPGLDVEPCCTEGEN